MDRIRWRTLARPVALIVAALSLSTIAVGALESIARIPDASTAYLVAVVVVAVAAGTVTGVVTAIGAFLLYDVLFVEPLHALTVADPTELLTLLLLLFVGVVAGRLAGSQRERAAAASRREREVRALLAIQRTLATAASAEAALPGVARVLVAETHFERVAIGLGDGAAERLATDTAPDRAFPDTAVTAILQHRSGAAAPGWVLVHSGQRARRAPRASVPHRISIEAGGVRVGTIRALRDPDAGAATVEETRLLASAADQIAQALERDRLASEATTAEVARRSDELKSALLDSVSHELRTPLAAIRATAGTLADPDVEWPADEVRGAGTAIDREAERLARLVGNLLDLGRIEGGALQPDRQPFVLADLVADAVGRSSGPLGSRRVDVAVPVELPAVLVDAVYLDLSISNILENAARYTPPDATVRIGAATTADASAVRLTIEDDGAGVPDGALGNLFEKFFRVARPNESARRGTGIGLTIVKGLVEAMGGSIAARRGALGGLALDVDLPVAAPLDAVLGDGPLDATA